MGKYEGHQKRILEILKDVEEENEMPNFVYFEKTSKLRVDLVRDAPELTEGARSVISFQLKCLDDAIRDRLSMNRNKRLMGD